jgi:phage shock protein A
MVELAIGTFIGILAWFINAVKSMAIAKIDDLHDKHKTSSSRLDAQCERLNEHRTEIEILKQTSIKRSDMDSMLAGLREDLKGDIDDVFTRVHERIDSLYARGHNMTKTRATD